MAAALGAGAATATAAPTGQNGARAQTWATGFDSDARRIGPFGLAFDDASRLYTLDRYVYRFAATGGAAPANRLSATPLAARATGLAFGLDGRLYAGRETGSGFGQVVELDPANGNVTRVVVDDVPCPLALVVDPRSGDLFVSTASCGNSVERIADPGGSPTMTRYFGGLAVDGLTFAPNGDLYMAHSPDADGDTVSMLRGRRPHRTGLAAVPMADGVALGRPEHRGGPPPFIVVNRNDGTVTKVEMQGSKPSQTTLMTGASRGDLVTVSDDGCLYATQTDSIVKLTNADRTCADSDAGTGPASRPLEHGLLPSRAAALAAVKGASLKRCAANRRLRVGLHFRGRLRSVRVYIGSRRVQTVRGRALRRPVALRSLPGTAFTVTLRATTRSGHKLMRRTRYSACGRHVLAKRKGGRR